nr:isoform 2 of multidrug resistance-associated protein 1 [Quercus suber]
MTCTRSRAVNHVPTPAHTVEPSNILIVDVMTSAIEEETEDRLMQIVKTQLKSSTVIMVAHRLRTIMYFDILFGMHAGRVVECGSPEKSLMDEALYRCSPPRLDELVIEESCYINAIPTLSPAALRRHAVTTLAVCRVRIKHPTLLAR